MSPDQESQRWQAFELEALPHADRLFRHAMWLERSRTEAEDLVQETFVRALESFHRYTPETNCRAWLLTILHHVRANRRRRLGREVLEGDVEERFANVLPFVPPIPDGLTDEDILLAVGQLPSHHQEVILLCDVEDMTYKDISAALGVPVGTVMSRLHRGRQTLRELLSPMGLRPREGRTAAGGEG